MSQGKGILRHRSPGATQLWDETVSPWKPRTYRGEALRGEGIPMAGHPETSEPRNHTALRGSLFWEALRCPGEGACSSAQERWNLRPALFLASSLPLLFLLLGFFQGVIWSSKSHKRYLLEKYVTVGRAKSKGLEEFQKEQQRFPNNEKINEII